MSKMIKNFLIVLSLVFTIVLVVFCIELFMLNRRPGDSGDEMLSQHAGNGDDEGAGAAEPQSPPGTAAAAGAGAPVETSRPPEQPPPRTGTRHELLMPGDLLLVLYVQEELFQYTELELAWMFTYTGEGAASLEICYAHMPLGVNALAEHYLDNYVGEDRTLVGNKGPIGRSALDGVFMSGDIDGENYEAWIHAFTIADLEDMGVSFVIHYRDNEQKEAIYSILDTLDIDTSSPT